MSDPNYLTTKEVAALLNCSESLVRRSDMKVKLGAFYIGKKALRFPKNCIDAYINEQKSPSFEHTVEELTAAKNTQRRKKLHSKLNLS